MAVGQKIRILHRLVAGSAGGVAEAVVVDDNEDYDIMAEVFIGRLYDYHVAIFVDTGRDVEFVEILANKFFVNCHNIVV